ncbi:MAG: glycoside hydrolase domain-containing protein [Dysgonomonas sp.]
MKKHYLWASMPITLILLCCIITGCQPKREAKTCVTFNELPDPTSDTLSDWSKVPAGLSVSFASIDARYPKSVAPDITKTSEAKLTGWKGEKLSAQVLLWTAQDISQIECEFSEFKSSVGTMDSRIAEARFVRYVMTDEFAGGCGYRKPEDFSASLSADMLDNIDCMDMPAKTVRPVWITVNIPDMVAAGDYKGKLTIFAEREKSHELEIDLTVQDRTLPPPSQWAYYLDLWQHPSAVARAQNLKLWSDEHFEAMKPLYEMLAAAGQKVVTATINKDPWNNQCYDRYEDMISWMKNADGTWTYDYTVFDKWVTFMQNLGITKMINCYSLAPWNNELCYKDAASGELITVKADPGTKIFEEIWPPFLTDFVKHLREKGWLDKTNIAMDERSPEVMQATMELLQRVAPELGISLADNHRSYKEYPHIREISVSANAKVDQEDITARREKGLITTYYVCCSDKFPNMFTFSDPAEAVYSAWYTVAADLDGFLRWAYNSWVENPVTDSRFRTWPAGDTYMVYPEARSSIRFERLIEGIQDAEKVRILRKDLKDANTEESLKKLEELNNEIAKFNTTKPSEPCGEMVSRGKLLIQRLSR